jgi:hypothetical protein
MSSGSIIIFGIFSAVLLILSCITLNAASFYNELEISIHSPLVSKTTLVLRDRSLNTLQDLN